MSYKLLQNICLWEKTESGNKIFESVDQAAVKIGKASNSLKSDSIKSMNVTNLATHFTPEMQLSKTVAPFAPRALELRLSSTLAVASLHARPSKRCFRAERKNNNGY